MNRRDTVMALLALGTAGRPLVAFAQQQGKVWRIGRLIYLRQQDFPDSHFSRAFNRGMRELGYVEGKNLIIEERNADNKPERLLGLAAELVQLKVDVIVSASPPANRAAQKATSTIPIVFLADSDPVGNGLVASLARPGGNITGLSSIAADISPKQLEMLRSMVPKLSRVAVLVNPNEGVSQASQLKSVQGAGQRFGATIQAFEARIPQDFENAFAQMVRWKAEGLIVASGPFLNNQPRLIAEMAAKHRLPTISALTEYVEAGGLISYGPSLTDMFRRGATYVDKIFKGAKPGDLPVEQPTVFELFVNLKTAKALKLTVPKDLLFRADKVIQ
jgi:putative ABC transport system substrate-binding protein